MNARTNWGQKDNHENNGRFSHQEHNFPVIEIVVIACSEESKTNFETSHEVFVLLSLRLLLYFFQESNIGSQFDQSIDWDAHGPSEETRDRNKDYHPQVSALKTNFLQIFEKSLFTVNRDAIDRLGQCTHNCGVEEEKDNNCRCSDFIGLLLHVIARRIQIPKEERNGENSKRKQSEGH